MFARKCAKPINYYERPVALSKKRRCAITCVSKETILVPPPLPSIDLLERLSPDLKTEVLRYIEANRSFKCFICQEEVIYSTSSDHRTVDHAIIGTQRRCVPCAHIRDVCTIQAYAYKCIELLILDEYDHAARTINPHFRLTKLRATHIVEHINKQRKKAQQPAQTTQD